jgi:DNA polymerase I-like protein with 3'-5' exonuclease and polymerase domains
MKINYKNKDIEVRQWQNERLGKWICLDTETDFTPSHIVPDLATVQAYAGGCVAYLVPLDRLRSFLNMHYDSNIIAQNASFDIHVIEKYLDKKLFDLYDRNKIYDTSVLYRLYHLAAIGFVPPRHNLKLISKKIINVDLDKNNKVRCNFMQFKGAPLNEIPDQFVEYMIMDVVATFDCWFELASRVAEHDKYGTLLSHNIQVKGEYALSRIHQNGIRFDLERRDEWLKGVKVEMDKCAEITATYGFVRGMKGNKERMLSALDFLGIKDKLPLTEKGAISTTAEVMAPYSNLPFVKAYLQFMELEKASSFVEGITNERIHGKFNSILNTGRVSMSKPNLQQIPRDAALRNMFIPEKGKEFYIIDYSGMENAMLGQVLLKQIGYSRLADTVNSGKDLHRFYASFLFNKPEKDITKEERQKAKAAVFGIPGGLGIDTFIAFAKGYGLNLSVEEATDMKNKYFEAFPEMRTYLNKAEDGDVFTLTGRKRADATYCAVANTPFQGLGSDMAKIAMYNLTKAGFKIVNYIHDEFILEQDKSVDRYKEACKIMIDAGKNVAPDMLIEVDGGKADMWTKM